MTTIALQNFVSDHFHIFSLPNLVLELDSLSKDPKATAEDFAALIQLDTGLTLQLLTLVNSAHYNLQKPIDTITAAITVIGLNDLRDLVMATKVIQKFCKVQSQLISPFNFWKHSIACAVANKVIAEKINIQQSERFFIIGLLHDIGKLFMLLKQPDLSKILMSHISNDINIEDIEKVLFGFSHDAVSAELMRKWNLPESLYIPCQHHHNPINAQQFKIESASLHLANVIANLIEKPLSRDDTTSLNPEIWEILGTKRDVLIPLTKHSEENYLAIVNLMMPKMAA